MVKVGGLLEDDDTVADAGERNGGCETNDAPANHHALQSERRLQTRHYFLVSGSGYQ